MKSQLVSHLHPEALALLDSCVSLCDVPFYPYGDVLRLALLPLSSIPC